MGWYDDHLLPRALNVVMRAERLSPYRKRTVGAARGRVLEIGLGSGVNLGLYGSAVTAIIGLDPHPKLLSMAAQEQARRPVEIVQGTAEQIPLASESIDSIVMTWTLCSIPNAGAALREMRRVLRPGGELLFAEHGLAPEPSVARWQHRLTPAWKHLAGGCHLDRPVADLVRGAGFEVGNLQTGYMPGPRVMTFMYQGQACKV